MLGVVSSNPITAPFSTIGEKLVLTNLLAVRGIFVLWVQLKTLTILQSCEPVSWS